MYLLFISFRYKSLLGLKQAPPATGENCVIMLRKLCPVRPGAFEVGITKVGRCPDFIIYNTQGLSKVVCLE